MVSQETTEGEQARTNRTKRARRRSSSAGRRRRSTRSNGKRLNSLVKGLPQECNAIALQQNNSVSYARTFQTPIYVNGHRLQAMVDSGSTGNFMAKALTEGKGFPTRKKSAAYELVAVDGQLLADQNGEVDRETEPLEVITQRHHETLTFDVIRMANHDIVLGMPWLRKHNPTVDWGQRTIKFKRCVCVTTAQPTHRQRSMVDEKQNRTTIARRELATSTKDDPNQESDSTSITEGQVSKKVGVIEGSNAPSENPRTSEKQIPDAYKKWKPLF